MSKNIHDTLYSDDVEEYYFAADWVQEEDVKGAVAELARWVESVEQGTPEQLFNSSYLYHTDWGDREKQMAASVEVAGLTGLNPRDIRPVVLDRAKGEYVLLDSGSCVCLEPAPPGLSSSTLCI